MRETVILPEMLQAGMEALSESQERDFLPHDAVIAIYLAMEAIRQIAIMRGRGEVMH